MVTKAILEAYDKGMGKGTAFIFPNLAYKLAADINFREGTPNYDLTLLACKVAAHRMNPMFIFCDASFNKPWGTTINYMGCRSRTGSNVHGPAIIEGRGNVSFTTLNLVGYALEAKGNVETFFSILDENLGIVERQLLHRYNILSKLKKRDIPFNMDGIYYGSDDLKDDDIVEPALKHGTHTFGFTGLTECLKVLLGVHHGESEDAQALGLRIVGRVRAYADYCTDKHNLNFSVIATPAEATASRVAKIDAKRFSDAPRVDYYTNSFQIPVDFPISTEDKLRIEGPYHALCNGGHNTYVELPGSPIGNVEAIMSILKTAEKYDLGYAGINAPMDICLTCGHEELVPDRICTVCGGTDINQIRRISGYFGLLGNICSGKTAEILDRVQHYDNVVDLESIKGGKAE